ncbi:hypothetical protein PRZ48_005703 [Zasmidium cellare]|uniref:Major facilitator superfamily (MFS) profile domain-containing protein n=1 Tax=Zasmidium cellare TaxID=395010 RepID=A0ABR0EM46_ZASCE|nr:hypothetical protein PRZ48_005703 [Zasmidium cellare]
MEKELVESKTDTTDEQQQDFRPTNERQEDFQPTWRFNAAFGSLMVLSLMASLDATSLSVAIPTIVNALHGTAIEGFWSGTSFLLTSTVFQPVLGSLSTVFGRKSMVMASIIFFGVGAVVAATASDMTALLVGRALQGSGGGGILVLTDVVITDLVPLRLRGNYFSLLGVMWAVGSVSGPIVGGAFAQTVSWRWILWINLPILGVGAPLVVLFLKLQFKATSLAQKLARIDWLGGGIFIGSMTAFLIGVSWGGVNYAWSSWHTLVPLIIGSIGMIVFVVWEDRFAVDPLIRTVVVKNHFPLYFQATKGASQMQTGVDLLPGTLTVAPAAIVTGRAITALGTYRWGIWVGWAVTTLGFGLQILLDVHTSTVAWVFITLWTGIGNGLLYPSLIYAIQAAIPDADQAYGVSLYNFFRGLGQTIGVAVGGAIFQNSIKQEIEKYPSITGHAQEWSKDASGLVQIIRTLPHDGAREDLVQCYANALRVVWIVMTAFSAFALVTSAWTQHFDLNRKLETDQGFAYGKNIGKEVKE